MTHLISRRLVPAAQRDSLDGRVRRGSLRPILPGVYTSEPTDTWEDRVLAAQLARPGAVIIGATAARLQFWPDLDDDTVHLAPARFASAPDWLRCSQASIPAELVRWRGELRVATPALAALQLVTTLGRRPLTEALRQRATTVAELMWTLNGYGDRPGTITRRQLLAMVRDSPWSPLEADAHALLRRAGIEGWQPNFRVRCGQQTFYLDIAFPELRLAIEIDGWAHHSTHADLDRDLARQNRLMLAGWTVLRFTARTLPEMPDQIRQLRQQIA